MWLNIQRTQGRNVTEEIRKSRGYRNPEFFRKMIEHYDIEQYGTCFPQEVFDPAGLPAEDFIEAQRAAVAAEEERKAAHRASTGRIEFVKGGGQAGPGAHRTPAEALAVAQARAAALAARVTAMDPKFAAPKR